MQASEAGGQSGRVRRLPHRQLALPKWVINGPATDAEDVVNRDASPAWSLEEEEAAEEL